MQVSSDMRVWRYQDSLRNLVLGGRTTTADGSTEYMF